MPQRSMANWMPSSFLPLKLGGVLVALIAGVAMFLGFFVVEEFRVRCVACWSFLAWSDFGI